MSCSERRLTSPADRGEWPTIAIPGDRLWLRGYVRADQVAADPAVAVHEATVWTGGADRNTDRRVVGVDPTAEHAGTLAALLTERPGQRRWAANQRGMRQLVGVHARAMRRARASERLLNGPRKLSIHLSIYRALRHDVQRGQTR